MDLIIHNKKIDAPIEQILHTLRDELSNGMLGFIGKEHDGNVKITCPFHKDGKEKRPSCHVYSGDSPTILYGLVHCFTCNTTVPLYTMVGYCFGKDDDFGKDWLVERFGNVFILKQEYLSPIELNNEKPKYLDESILENYKYLHPYQFQRGLSEDIIKKFNIGWNPQTDSITFPVWDIHNNLVGITERSTKTKRFYIPEKLDKPIYLLNYIINEHHDCVYVCESQINALTLWTWGYPAIALFGTGSEKQYAILNKSGIRNYVLCFDGDSAGDKGAYRFTNAIKNALILKKSIPRGKDVNDLSKEEFDNLFCEFITKRY